MQAWYIIKASTASKEKNRHQRKDEYKEWLKSVYIPTKTIFSIIDAQGSVLNSTSFEDYVLLDSDIGCSSFKDYTMCYVSLRTREISNTRQDEDVYLIY